MTTACPRARSSESATAVALFSSCISKTLTGVQR